jgi:hypothetical protein
MSDAWERGFAAGWRAYEIKSMGLTEEGLASGRDYYMPGEIRRELGREESKRYMKKHMPSKPKRKLSAWNKYVKANANKPRFKYKSGAKKGKLNLKKMAVAFRKTPAGKKSKR